MQPLGVALGTALTGRLTARINAEGPIDRAMLHGQIVGTDIAAGPALFDRVRLGASIADLTRPRIAVTGEFRGGGLDGTLALDADLEDRAELAIQHLQVKAADGEYAAAYPSTSIVVYHACGRFARPSNAVTNASADSCCSRTR